MRIISGFVIFAILAGPSVSSVVAQEETSPKKWTIVSTVETVTTTRVICTLLVPKQSGLPALRIWSEGRVGADGDIEFQMRDVGELNVASIEGIQLSVDDEVIATNIAGVWASADNGRLIFTIRAQRDSIAKAMGTGGALTVSLRDNAHRYDLSGSRQAFIEFDDCLY